MNLKIFLIFASLFFENCIECWGEKNKKDVLKIIKNATGLGEVHKVTTEDGYILKLFRIPPEKTPKGVILFQHGLPFDAKSWVAKVEDSPAILFWEAGYDVWLLNSRGTYYSDKHTSLDPSKEKYWNFTFHEMGLYDMDANIKYVKNITKQEKVVVLAYSAGASSALIYASLKSEEAAKSIKFMALVAPAAYLSHTKTPTYPLYYNPSLIYRSGVYKIYKIYSFPSRDPFYTQLFKVTFLLENLYRDSATDEYIGNYLSPSSLKNYDHFIQLTQFGADFQWYDYGSDKNVEIYGTLRPPSYPLKNVKVPIHITYSNIDLTVVPKDANLTYNALSKEVRFGFREIYGFTHLQIIFGRKKNEMIFNGILDEINKMN